MRILYIQRGLAPPPKDARLEQFSFLSDAIEGDVLLPVWWKTKGEAQEELGRDSYPVCTVRNFRYHLLLAGIESGFRQRLAMLLFYVRTGRSIYREKPFDCIVTVGHSLTAFAGVILKWLTSAKLILEINGEPGRAYLFDTSLSAITRRAAAFLSVACLHFAAWCADRLRLLYPQQLSGYPLLRRVPVSVFHAFVPTSMVRPTEARERYVIFAGYPWYLKGVDILIRAFRIIAPEFPDVRLVLQGHFPDRTELERLIGGCSQIEIHMPRTYRETLDAIAHALIVALPTRTEGMGRVLVEAMAARRPCVASAVGGVPYYVRDEYNGLLVRTEDAGDLADKLRRLLTDSELRERLAENAFEFAQRNFSEKAYVEHFVTMLSQTLGR
ncbi:MAG: glycosyltransferase family 4 protein [Bryobacteraceae bacterium]|jgi:glycosyltransferase involved in cell wall biosynthesis